MRLNRIDDETAESAITCLSIMKSVSTLYDNENAGNKISFEPCNDTVHELYFDAIDFCAKKNYSRYFEDASVEINGIENEDMTEYYKLAYRLGDIKNLSDSNNPYLIDADKAIYNTLGTIEHYSFDYRMQVKKQRKPRLMLIFYTDGYYPNAEVIYELYKFIGFYRETIPLLQSELRELESKRKLILNPRQKKANKSKERKKAA